MIVEMAYDVVYRYYDWCSIFVLYVLFNVEMLYIKYTLNAFMV